MKSRSDIIMNSLIDTLNRAAETAIGFAQPMFLQSALLILLLLALDFALRRRVRATVRYVVWILLLIKLVLPPSLALPTGIGYWLGAGQDVTSRAPKLETPAMPKFEMLPAGQKMYSLLTDDMARRRSLRGESRLLLVWAGGALALFAILARRSRAVRRRISAASNAPEQLSNLLAGCCRQLNLRRLPQLRVTDAAMSPAVCGLWRPVILLPARLVEKLSEPQLRAVLLHELAHVKRADVWANYAQTLLQILYWWHPLLWLANARVRRVREEAVDEFVVVELGREAETYPVTLVEVAKLTLSRAVLSLGLVGILESKSALKQRVHRLVNYPPPHNARLSFASVVVCVALGAVVLPMARGQRDTAEIPAQTASAAKAEGEPPFVGATGNFVLLPKKKLETMLLPRTAPTYSAPGVRGWPISKTQYETYLARAKGLGGLQSGTDTALLPGLEGFVRNGASIELGITTQLISRSPQGKRTGEARFIPPNRADAQASGGSQIALVATAGKTKTKLELTGLCETSFGQKLTGGAEKSSTETNFIFSAKLEQPADHHGVLLVCDRSEQNDGRALIVLLATRPRSENEVNGQGVIRVSANGVYALDGQTLTLDELHKALFQEKQKFFKYSVSIVMESASSPGDVAKVSERLNELRIDVASVEVPKAVAHDVELRLRALNDKIHDWQKKVEASAKDPEVKSVRLETERQYLASLEKDKRDLEAVARPALKSISLKAKFINAPAAIMRGLLPARVATGPRRYGVTTSLSPDELTSAWSFAGSTNGFEILAEPAITTTDGREAAMFVGAISDNKFMQGRQPEDPKQDGATFSANAIGYVNVLKPGGKEIPQSFLIGPSLQVLPKIVADGIELSAEATVTQAAPFNDLVQAGNIKNTFPVRTNFHAQVKGLIQSGGGWLLFDENPKAKNGTSYAVIVSAKVEEK